MAFLNVFVVVFQEKKEVKTRNKNFEHPPSQEARRGTVKKGKP